MQLCKTDLQISQPSMLKSSAIRCTNTPHRHALTVCGPSVIAPHVIIVPTLVAHM